MTDLRPLGWKEEWALERGGYDEKELAARDSSIYQVCKNELDLITKNKSKGTKWLSVMFVQLF